MAKGAEDYAKDYTHPELRERLKEEIKAGDRGGAPGKWSARKSQLLTQEYEKQGGGYRHPDQRTDAQRSLEHQRGCGGNQRVADARPSFAPGIYPHEDQRRHDEKQE